MRSAIQETQENISLCKGMIYYYTQVSRDCERLTGLLSKKIDRLQDERQRIILHFTEAPVKIAEYTARLARQEHALSELRRLEIEPKIRIRDSGRTKETLEQKVARKRAELAILEEEIKREDERERDHSPMAEARDLKSL